MLRDAVQGNQLENVRRLYEVSFPKSEKKPFAFMLQKQKEGIFDILAIEDEQGAFRGLAIMMLSGDRALLDYLAIEPDCQGGGIGSGTLAELRERYGEERIVVEIESTAEGGGEDAVSGNGEKSAAAEEAGDAGAFGEAVKEGRAAGILVSSRSERLRRKAFYLRNGMVPMDFLVELFGVEMEVLTFGSELTFEQYHAIYKGALPKPLAEKVRLRS